VILEDDIESRKCARQIIEWRGSPIPDSLPARLGPLAFPWRYFF
jgi:hypothetical protein